MPSNKKTAMEVASAYLANRMRTAWEVRKHLKDKEFPEQEIDETVNDLIGLRYLDDYEYAKIFYERNAEKHRGSSRAMRELEEKGVDRETIKFALEDFLYEAKIDEYEMALEIASKACDGAKEIDDKLIAKVARKLEGAGYKSGDIVRVLGEMRRWNNGREKFEDN